MGRIQTLDYSTGDVSQWDQVQNVTCQSELGFAAAYTWQYRDLLGTYPLQVVSDDSDCGYVARMEVRNGDTLGTNERSELAALPQAINTSRWEAFSVKFDTTFPNDCASYGWSVTNQWVAASGVTWTITPNCLDGATPAGTWTLVAWDGGSSNIRLLDVPLNRGKWIDVKMNIGWYDDSRGFVKVWLNGIRQNLRYTSWMSGSGGDTYTGRTVYTNTSGTFYYKEGLYRQGGVGFPTGIIYHANYRSATDEASL